MTSIFLIDRPPLAELLTHPQYISRLAFYTIPLILVASILAYMHNYKLISLLLVGIFITSVIHWNKHSQVSFIRFLDVFLVAILLIVSIFYINKKHRVFWYSSILFICFIYILNHLYYYYAIVDKTSSLYTLPNTKKRETAHYNSVYVHLLFSHIGLFCSGIYCLYF
jgi:hypothetical protein